MLETLSESKIGHIDLDAEEVRRAIDRIGQIVQGRIQGVVNTGSHAATVKLVQEVRVTHETFLRTQGLQQRVPERPYPGDEAL